VLSVSIVSGSFMFSDFHSQNLPKNKLCKLLTLYILSKCITVLFNQNEWSLVRSQGIIQPFFLRKDSDEVGLEHPGGRLGVADALEGDGGVVAEVLGHHLLPTRVEP